MIDPSSLLRSYLRGVLHLCGAEAACLYLPARSAMPAALLHEGHGDPPAELADFGRAAAFAEEAAARRKSRTEGGRRRELPSSSPAAVLVPVGCPEPAEPASAGRERRRYGLGAPCAGWLGLVFASGGLPARQRLAQLPPELWDSALEQGSALIAHALQVSGALRDPVSGLPNRQALQSALAAAMEEAGASGRPLSLLFVNPDDFEMVNRELGREAGDRVIGELAARLRSALRGSDLAARYGGVVHAALLRGVGPAEARPTAEKVLLRVTEGAFLEGAVRLGVSAGVAWFDPADPDGVASPFDLLHRADQALSAAKRAGGSRLAVWDARLDLEEIGNLDRLTGMFTGNLSRDYRNMVLLWEALNAIAESEDPDRLAGRIVQRIQATFLPDRVALFVRREGRPEPLCQAGRWPGEGCGLSQLAAHEREVVERACREPQPAERSAAGAYACAVPLATAQDHLGCLFLSGAHPCDSSDLIFLKGLAAQLAVALDRARLAEIERARQAAERQRLEREVGELRSALQRARLESISPEMARVIATARRVAPTDATVLITGESGTGKELLAATVHELSERRNRPFVVVDCSALAATLAESELFGHERGAYTGAQERSAGRLASADGGTVLLDEIGELPLEVQSKLLRFVQEKQLTPVGGTRPRKVDVRILAATNRDLAAEVAAGRFRGDLYYRLKVVQLEVPPLRARKHDILHLARHFLRAQAVLFRKPVNCFTCAAEAAMLQHPWPGNVRELQNRVMQAVLLCDGEEIGPAELGFDLPRAIAPGIGDPAAPPAPAVPGGPAWPAGDEAWNELSAQLGRLVRHAAVAGAGAGVMPLGRWLQNDLVLEAHTAASGIARRGAALLGLPETTFRTRCHAALDQVEAGVTFRPSGWEAVRSAIRAILASGCPPGEDVLERAQQILLREIVALVPAHARLGPALLGVTPPTYRRRVEALHGAAHAAGELAGNGSASSPLRGVPQQLSL